MCWADKKHHSAVIAAKNGTNSFTVPYIYIHPSLATHKTASIPLIFGKGPHVRIILSPSALFPTQKSGGILVYAVL